MKRESLWYVLFVSVKLTLVAPVALAVTLYGPPIVPLAVTLCETAPLEIVAVLMAGLVLAPEDGALKVTTPPSTGSLDRRSRSTQRIGKSSAGLRRFGLSPVGLPKREALALERADVAGRRAGSRRAGPGRPRRNPASRLPLRRWYCRPRRWPGNPAGAGRSGCCRRNCRAPSNGSMLLWEVAALNPHDCHHPGCRRHR